jgi:hypothetical protein
VKIALIFAATVLLSSCAEDGQFRTSTNLNGQSFSGSDFSNPRFYMDSDAPPSSSATAPTQGVPRYGIDGYCGYCRRY